MTHKDCCMSVVWCGRSGISRDFQRIWTSKKRKYFGCFQLQQKQIYWSAILKPVMFYDSLGQEIRYSEKIASFPFNKIWNLSIRRYSPAHNTKTFISVKNLNHYNDVWIIQYDCILFTVPSPEVIRHSVSKKFRCGTSLFKQNDCRELIVLGLVTAGVTSSFLGLVSSELNKVHF